MYLSEHLTSARLKCLFQITLTNNEFKAAILATLSYWHLEEEMT